MAFTYKAGAATGTEQSASSTTVAATVSGISVGDLVAVFVKHEGASGTISISDGTSSLTVDPSEGIVHHGNGDLHSAWYYILSSVASGSVTYTATFLNSEPFRSIMVWDYSYTDTASFDAAQSASGSASSAVASGTINTASTSEVALGGYGEYSARTISAMQINGVNADHTHQFTSINFTATWDRILSATFSGGQATGTLTDAEAWNAHIIAFKETAGGPVTVGLSGSAGTGGSGTSVPDFQIPL